MSNLSRREKIIREALRKEKRERWTLVEKIIRDGDVGMWLDFWDEHWPPSKSDAQYLYGWKGDEHLFAHIKIEVHYMRQSKEKQFSYEQMFADVGKESKP